jgi:hypothetical protein
MNSLPCNKFVQKVVPQVKKLSLFVTAFKDLYVSRVLILKKIIIPQAAHQDLGMCFHKGFLRFTPSVFNYSLFTVFFCLSAGSVNKKNGFSV